MSTAAKRRARCVELRTNGFKFAEIADALGYRSERAARADFESACRTVAQKFEIVVKGRDEPSRIAKLCLSDAAQFGGSLTFVVGLCGAGKTHTVEALARMVPKPKVIDEGVSDDGRNGRRRRGEVLAALKLGHQVIVADLFIGHPKRRAMVLRSLRLPAHVPVTWMWLENDLRAANRNCRRRRNKGDAEGHVGINLRWSPKLEPPEGAIHLKIHRLNRRGT